MHVTSPRIIRALVLVVAAATTAVLVACGPLESEVVVPTTPEWSASPGPSASSTPTPTESAQPGFALPESCEQLYSPTMFADLSATNPPLNDPGVTIYATENVAGLETLASGAPTMRCTWGVPGGSGLATNVTVISAAQSEALVSAFVEAGMACTDLSGGTICRIEQQLIDREDNVVRVGEAQYVREEAWVATHWVNFAPAGYTEDIVATLWP